MPQKLAIIKRLLFACYLLISISIWGGIRNLDPAFLSSDRSNSFEEELFRGLPRDDANGDDDDDVIMSDDAKMSTGPRMSGAR